MNTIFRKVYWMSVVDGKYFLDPVYLNYCDVGSSSSGKNFYYCGLGLVAGLGEMFFITMAYAPYNDISNYINNSYMDWSSVKLWLPIIGRVLGRFVNYLANM